MSDKIVFIDGCRTPFLKSGSNYMDLMSYQLGQYAIRGLLIKTGVLPQSIDQVVMGTVISNLQTSNVARESAVTAGLLQTTPCHTVTMACISANRAISSVIEAIKNGQSEVAIAGGVDSTSDTPITFNKPMRKKLFKAQKLRGFGDTLKFIFSLRPKDFFPEQPKVAEFLTHRVMGQDCDIMAARFNVSREAQDKYAVRSHQLAAKAWSDGFLQHEVCRVEVPPSFNAIDIDNGIRGDSTMEKVSRLRPAFDKKYGTLTAANSSFLTDGAAVSLLCTAAKAKTLGLKAKAEIVDYVFTAQNLEDELLLGPAYAISKLLDKVNLKLDDIDVIELHEAFAGQVLANIEALASNDFAKKHLGREKAVGNLNFDKLNTWGGSLSIGHPFGATGSRLLTTAANRLHHENGTYALIAACAAGAHGHAMLIKKCKYD